MEDWTQAVCSLSARALKIVETVGWQITLGKQILESQSRKNPGTPRRSEKGDQELGKSTSGNAHNELIPKMSTISSELFRRL